jgi:hypothetical protein
MNSFRFRTLRPLGAFGLIALAVALHVGHLEATTFVGHLSHSLAWVHQWIIMDD